MKTRFSFLLVVAWIIEPVLLTNYIDGENICECDSEQSNGLASPRIPDIDVMEAFTPALPGTFISGIRHEGLCPHISKVSARDASYLLIYLNTGPRICLDIHTYICCFKELIATLICAMHC